jgi:hypothetical protein
MAQDACTPRSVPAWVYIAMSSVARLLARFCAPLYPQRHGFGCPAAVVREAAAAAVVEQVSSEERAAGEAQARQEKMQKVRPWGLDTGWVGWSGLHAR